jgi:hypothetical protein
MTEDPTAEDPTAEDPTDEEPKTSYQLKLGWARQRLQQLREAYHRWLVDEGGAGFHFLEEEPTHHVCRFRILKPLPPELQLLAGDCAHAARQALDHLAYALSITVTEQEPPTNESRSEFPLFSPIRNGDLAAFDKSLLAKVGKARADLDTAVYDALEELQPYNGGEMEWLGHLDELDRIDKHRFLPVVTGTGVAAGWTFSRMTLYGLPRTYPGPADDGQVVAEWWSDAVYYDRVSSNFRVFMVFGPTSTLLAGANVPEVLQKILDVIDAEVLPRIEPLL